MRKNELQTEEKEEDDQLITNKSSPLDLPRKVSRHLFWKHDGNYGRPDLFDMAKEISCIAPFSPDLILIGSYDGTVRVWNLRTQCFDHVFFAEKGYISFVAKLSDEKIVCGCQDNALQIWDLVTREVKTIPTPSHMPACGVVLPSGEVLSASYLDNYGNKNGRLSDGTFRLWNLETGKGVNLAGVVNCIVQTAKGTIISGSRDKQVDIWLRDKRIETLRGCQATVVAVAELSTGLIVAVDEKSIIYVWDRTKPLEPKVIQSNLEKVDSIIGIAALPDDSLLCISTSMRTVWDLEAGICLKKENSAERLTKAVLITEDRTIITGTKSGGLLVEDLSSLDFLANKETANSLNM